MIPLRDDIPARRFPAATLAIIGLNAGVFLHELTLGHRLGPAFFEWGLVPTRYTNAELADQFGLVEQVAPFLSAMFLHGGWIHLIGNMWVLWIFGDNVEDQLGRARFVALYLLSGIVAAILHVVANAHSVLPAIGASGAVAGVMGAYVLLFPRARVATLIP
ncbi:MAG: rhomboid family intramembrane serine protease, partial [Verrucomicrobia bacterium]|nr:rhomboid family intramembrane serine protease [Verrucomicrobiota bacterium]